MAENMTANPVPRCHLILPLPLLYLPSDLSSTSTVIFVRNSMDWALTRTPSTRKSHYSNTSAAICLSISWRLGAAQVGINIGSLEYRVGQYYCIIAIIVSHTFMMMEILS